MGEGVVFIIYSHVPLKRRTSPFVPTMYSNLDNTGSFVRNKIILLFNSLNLFTNERFCSLLVRYASPPPPQEMCNYTKPHCLVESLK